MAEQLGSLARTHTCGALRAAHVGADVVLLGWVQKVRDLGAILFLDVRDRHGLTQVVVQDDRGAARARQAAARGVRRRSPGPGGAARRRNGQRQAADRRDRGAGGDPDPAQRGQDAAVPHRRRAERLGGDAASLPLPRPAAAAAAAEHRLAPPRDHGAAPLLRRAGLLGDRDPDSHQVDAGRRPRLPGAEPGPSRGVLRAAAVAADLQADPDDRRHGQVRADRPLLPRRGAARRSAARIHPGRSRDGLRAARDGVRGGRGRAGGLLPGDWRRDRHGRSAA